MKLDIDFCIIKNPLESSKDNLLIFITKSGFVHLDDSTKDGDGYLAVVDELKKVSYLETDSFRFEYIQSSDIKNSNNKDLESLLTKAGATYSKGLEDAIMEDFDTIKNGLDLNFINDLIKQADVEDFGSSIDEAFYKLQTNEPVKSEASEEVDPDFKLPKIKESIDLNMYLFVDLLLLDDTKDFSVDISGGFVKESKESASGFYKSLIKIFSDSFKRVNYNENPEVIELVSEKSKGDIYKEISFLYDVVIDVIKARKFNDRKTILETDGYYFNILDLKEKINMEEKIYFEVNVEDFKTMLRMSKDIELEKKTSQEKKTIDIDEVTEECEEFIDSLEESMLIYADEEEFQEALRVKNLIGSIKSKLKSFKERVSGRKKICIGEFHGMLNADL